MLFYAESHAEARSVEAEFPEAVVTINYEPEASPDEPYVVQVDDFSGGNLLDETDWEEPGVSPLDYFSVRRG